MVNRVIWCVVVCSSCTIVAPTKVCTEAHDGRAAVALFFYVVLFILCVVSVRDFGVHFSLEQFVGNIPW